MQLKKLIPLFVLVFALLACNLQNNLVASSTPTVATFSVENATESGASTVTPTVEPAPLPFPEVASPVLLHIDFKDVLNGWGVAADPGYILRTADGGTTWVDVTPPDIDKVGMSTNLFALDVNTVWLLNPNSDFFTGTFYHTTDGGATWTSNPVPFGGGWLQFLDANVGRVLADRGAGAGSQAVELYQTSDGGATWVSVFHNDPMQPGSSNSLPLSGIKSGMRFLDANTGWVTGSRPMDGDVYLFVTHDGGVSWLQQSIPLPPGYESALYDVQAPVFFGNDGFLPVLVYLANQVTLAFYTTHDGGAMWSGDPSNPAMATSPGHEAFADALHAWVWDGGPNLYVTSDGAQSWTEIPTSLGLSERLLEFSFVPDISSGFVGWALTAVDDSGYSQLYRTVDNGVTWMALIP